MGSRKPSPAMLVALVSLFIALGGSSYAALQLPRGSVGTKQLKNNAVTSKKVRNNSLLVRDFGASQRELLRGPQGARGPQGLKGDKGDKGDPGRSALTPLQSGETIRGGFAFDDQASGTGGDYGGWVPFPIPAPQPVVAANIEVVQVGATSATCTGTEDAPTAPPGRLCVYVGVTTPAGNTVAALNPGATEPEGARHGFVLRWTSTGPDQTDVLAYGTWAYTAP